MLHMRRRPGELGLTLIETAVSMVLISILLAILLPALSSARALSYRENCHENQRRIGQAWHAYLAANNDQFPTVPVQPAWFYGGMRFSVVNENPFPDYSRPLTIYLPPLRSNDSRDVVWCCPGDHGISDPSVPVGTGRRTAFRSYGTSYRANAALLYAIPSRQHNHDGEHEYEHKHDAPQPPVQPEVEPRGLKRHEITTTPSRLVLGGDAVWYEAAERTGRKADWHNVANGGNLLFLDGSVRFSVVKPRSIIGPVVFDPVMRGGAFIQQEPPPAPQPPPSDDLQPAPPQMDDARGGMTPP